MKKATPQSLLNQALKAAKRAYAPYSQYEVGAAVLTTDGTVYTGCNVENASHGLTLCAERVAIAKAVADGHRKFAAIAIAAGVRTPASPCGACLQVLSEFCPTTLPIHCTTLDGKMVKKFTLHDFLPRSFTLKNGKDKEES